MLVYSSVNFFIGGGRGGEVPDQRKCSTGWIQAKKISTVKKDNTFQDLRKSDLRSTGTKNPDNKGNPSQPMLNITRSKWNKRFFIKFLSLLIPGSASRGRGPHGVTSVAVVRNPLRAREILPVVLHDYLILKRKTLNC